MSNNKAVLTDEQIEDLKHEAEMQWGSFLEVSNLAAKSFARAIEAAVLASADNPSQPADEWTEADQAEQDYFDRHPDITPAPADNPSTAGATKGGITSTWPKRIWLQYGESEPEAYPGAGSEITWCENNINGAGDIEYVRADLAAPALNPSEVRDQALIHIGRQMANVMFNLAQRPGDPLTGDVVAMMDSLRKQWDAALRTASKEGDQAATDGASHDK